MRLKSGSGLSLAWSTQGVGDPVLFLHPIGLCRDFWAPAVAHISPYFRTICLDLRGHGESEAYDAPISLSDLAADVLDVARFVGNPRVAIVGCSLGGILAQMAVARAPDRFSAVVLANTLHKGPDPEGIELRARRSETGMAAVEQETLDRWFCPDFRTAEPKVVDQVRKWLLQSDPVFHGRCWRAMKSFDLTEELRHINAPTLVITGSADRSTPPSVSRVICDLLPHAVYREIPGAGHLAPIEQPVLFAKLVCEHLERSAR